MVLFESAGLLTEENKEIIAFGLERLYGFVTSLAFSVVCAGLMGDFFAGVLFESAYIMLRRFAGGIMQKTKEIV